MHTPFYWHGKEWMLYYTGKKGVEIRVKTASENKIRKKQAMRRSAGERRDFSGGGLLEYLRANKRNALYPAHGNRESAACISPISCADTVKSGGSGMHFRPGDVAGRAAGSSLVKEKNFRSMYKEEVYET